MEWVAFALVYTLVPLALLGLLVWGVVGFARRGRDEPDPGIGTVRRLFIYGGTVVGAFMGASGLALLVGGLVDLVGPGDIVIGEQDTTLALGLSLTVVGVPVWALFWWAGERSLRQHAVESRSVARRLAANLIRAVAMTVVVFAGIEVVHALLGTEDFSGEPWGWLLAWSGLWAVQEQRLRAEAPTTAETKLLDRLYLYGGSALGLLLLGTSVGWLVFEPLRRVYDEAFRASPVVRDSLWENMREPLAVFLVATPLWYWHWARNALHDVGTTLWRVHIFLLGVLSGVVAALVGTGIVLHRVLTWLLDAANEPAAEHFDPLPGAATAIIVGASTWAYHRLTLRAMAPAVAERSEPERVYRYLMAAAGLATLAAGLLTAFELGVEALTPGAEVIHGGGWWRDRLALALTLVLTGGPLWGWFWFDVQRQVARSPAVARLAASRRVYIFGVAGIAVLTAVVNLVIVLFRILEALLADGLTQDTIFDVRWSVGLLLTTGAIGMYYWLVLREDRASLAGIGPVEAPRRATSVVLVASEAAGDALVQRLEDLGDRVTWWQRLDEPGGGTPLPDEAASALLDRIAAIDAERVIVLVDAAGVAEVVPYRTR